jgi:ribosomal protein S18 acetylase RimI-like enzyme
MSISQQQLTETAYAGERVFYRMHALALAHPASTLHAIDLPYRLCSPALHNDPQRDIRLWEDVDGNLAAWAVWQQPFITLDFAYNPECRSANITEKIMAWAISRFEEIAASRGEQLSYWIAAREGDQARIELLERYDFTWRGWYMLHMSMPLTAPRPTPPLPEGFTLRPLRGEEGVEAYVETHRAAFGSENMTVEWRRRILSAPGHAPDLDLVIEAPDGRLAAVTIGWMSMDGQEGQIEPLAVHPAYHRKGLGRALLTEGLRRLHTHGARNAHIEVDCDNPAAISLYELIGYKPDYQVLFHGREF